MSAGAPSREGTPTTTVPLTAPARRPRRAGADLSVALRTDGQQRLRLSAPARELVLAALGGVVLALLATWPLAAHISTRIEPDLGDPVRTAWQVAWVGHALLHDPFHLFDSNAFYPHPLSLAFSDSLLGYGPAALFGSGTVAALARYNALFLLAWSLCFVGAYALARELGLRRLGAAACGVAFAYAPYRVTEAGHLHVISSGGIPLALALLVRGYRRRSRGLVLAGWLVSAWQVSLGFTLGLQYCYLLAVLALLLGWRQWRSRRRGWPPVPRELLSVSAAGLAVLLAVTAYQARPYLRVAALYPTATRPIAEVEKFSSGPAALLAAPSGNRVWASLTAGMRSQVKAPVEDVFFPGGLILALAFAGLAAGGLPRSLRLGLAGGIAVVSVLALGLGLTGAGYPYRLLYDYAPGWDGVRVPGRVFTLATLGYAILAGAGAQAALGLLRRARSRPPARLLGAVAAAGLLAAIFYEGAGRMPDRTVPQPARAEVGLRGPVLDLPTDQALDRVWQYFSTDGFYKLANGDSTFDLPALDDLRGGMAGFPDRDSVEKLRWYGIHTVVLHMVPPRGLPPDGNLNAPEPRDPTAAAAKPITGLGITRRRVGSLVIYTIGPGPKALHAGGDS